MPKDTPDYYSITKSRRSKVFRLRSLLSAGTRHSARPPPSPRGKRRHRSVTPTVDQNRAIGDRWTTFRWFSVMMSKVTKMSPLLLSLDLSCSILLQKNNLCTGWIHVQSYTVNLVVLFCLTAFHHFSGNISNQRILTSHFRHFLKGSFLPFSSSSNTKYWNNDYSYHPAVW